MYAVLSRKSYLNEPVPVFRSTLFRSTIDVAESGNNGGSQPRSNALCDFASARLEKRVVTTSLHPTSVIRTNTEATCRIRFIDPKRIFTDIDVKHEASK
jgi:hypothetical protein